MNFRDLRRGMLVIANTLDKLRPSRELSLAKTAIQNSGMWAGTFLGAAKLEENPYSKGDGKRVEIKDIEEMFDKTNQSLSKEIVGKGLIYTVDQMREYVGKQSSLLTEYLVERHDVYTGDGEFTEHDDVEMNICLINIKSQLITARLWLGMELNRIKREGDGSSQSL